MGTRFGWIKTCPAVLQMIANQDLKAPLPPEAGLLGPSQFCTEMLTLLGDDSNQPTER